SGVVLTGRLSPRSRGRLPGAAATDGALKVPAAALLEMIVRAGNEVDCGSLEEVVVEAPLTVPEHGHTQVRVSVAGPGPDGRRRVAVHGRPLDPEQGPWTCHARAVLVPGMPQPTFDLGDWPLPADGDALLPGAHRVWQQDGQTFAEIALPAELADEAAEFTLHPVLLDTALSVLDPRGTADLSVCAGLAVYAEGAASLRLRITPAPDGRPVLELADPAGEPVAVLGPLTLTAPPAEGAGVLVTTEAPGAGAAEAQTPSVALTRRVV
ncbi:hypothetical protein VR46_25815, partial [Streptomyces sp. NRRL S-444]